MKTNRMTPVGLGDGRGLDLSPDPETGNAREIKEGTGGELEVGRTNGREIGILGRGTRTGYNGVEATERVARVGM
jgi:hypothetical protein